MAIVSALEIWSDREASGSWDARGIRRVWDVVLDTAAADGYVIGDDPQFPKPGDPHPRDVFSRVTRKRVVPAGGPLHWRVECDYEATFPQAGGTTGQNDDPTGFPPEFEWDFAGGTEEVQREPGTNGRPLVNSAGDPFDGLKVEVYDQVLRITVNLRTYNASLYRQYCTVPTVNNDTFLGAPAGLVKCGPISGKWVRWRGFSFWRVTFVFFFRWDGWKRRLRQEGYRYWDSSGPSGAVKKAFADHQVHLLDDNGAKLADTATPIYTGTTSNPDFKLYVEKPFSVFNLVVPA